MKTSESKFKGKIFCFLPLHQESPLNCHVNGYFALAHENRRSLFSASESHFDNTRVLNSVNWNKAIVENIICPCYIRLIEICIDRDYFGKFDKQLRKYDYFFRNEIEAKNSRDYFEEMFKKFYKDISEVPCVPLETTPRKWLKPYDPTLYFTRTFKNFLRQETDTLKLTQCFTGHINLCYKIEECFEILTKIQINITSRNKLLDLFKKFADRELHDLKGETIISALNNSDALLLNKPINETLLKSSENLLSIYKFCQQDEEAFKKDIRVFLCADDVLRRTDNNLFIYKKEHLFKKSLRKFLHKDFFWIFYGTDYVKSISIPDLPELLVENIDCVNFVNPSQTFSNCPPADSIPEELFIAIWEIIISNFGQNVNTLKSKSDRLKFLESIRDFSLIPFQSTPSELSSSDTFLAPIKLSPFIIQRHGRSSFESLIEASKLPILKLPSKVDNLKIEDLINNLVTEISNHEDFLNLLYQSKSFQPELLENMDIKTAKNIVYYFNGKIKAKKNDYEFECEKSLKKEEAFQYLRELPIYCDALDQRFSVNSTNFLVLDREIPIAGLEEYFTVNNYRIIIESKMTLSYLTYDIYDYLGLQRMPYLKFYKKFIPFVASVDKSKLIEHVELLRNHQKFLSTKDNEFEEVNSILADTQFIPINDTFKSPKELYDSNVKVFKYIFNESDFLPAEYHDSEWFEFIKKLGFNTKIQPVHLIKLAESIKNSIENNQVEEEDEDDLIYLLIDQINKLRKDEKLDDTFEKHFQSIKFVRPFIPDSIQKRIFEVKSDLICLQGRK